jgi:uncharacterized protein YxjI
MGRQLAIMDKLLSIRGRVFIADETGDAVYEARGEFRLIFPATWRLAKNGLDLVSIRRQIFAFAPTWEVDGRLGEFTIRKKIFSLVERYQVIGGPFDKAELTGNIWDMGFELTRCGRVIASASTAIFSLRERQSITVNSDDEDDELLVATLMTTFHMARRSGAAGEAPAIELLEGAADLVGEIRNWEG